MKESLFWMHCSLTPCSFKKSNKYYEYIFEFAYWKINIALQNSVAAKEAKQKESFNWVQTALNSYKLYCINVV
jgi:hypothetical protein